MHKEVAAATKFWVGLHYFPHQATKMKKTKHKSVFIADRNLQLQVTHRDDDK